MNNSRLKAYGWLEKHYHSQMITIDHECFEQEPSKTALSWAESRPEMYTVLTYDDCVVGYGLVIPVNYFAHQALKQGEMSEDELHLKYVTSSEECSGLYLASIAATKKAGSILRSRLVGYTMGSLLRSTAEVFAITVTTDGDNLARELVGMEAFPYQGPMRGVNDYVAKLYCRNVKRESVQSRIQQER